MKKAAKHPPKQTMFGRKIKERLDSHVDKSSKLTYYLGLQLAKPERPAQTASSLTERE